MRLTPNEIDNTLELVRRREPAVDTFTLNAVEVVLLELGRGEYVQLHESNAKRLMDFDKRLERRRNRDE